MMLTIDADDAWWPPTFTPDAVVRTLFGVVDDPRGEPQHPRLDRLEHLEIDVAGAGDGAGRGSTIQLLPLARTSS